MHTAYTDQDGYYCIALDEIGLSTNDSYSHNYWLAEGWIEGYEPCNNGPGYTSDGGPCPESCAAFNPNPTNNTVHDNVEFYQIYNPANSIYYSSNYFNESFPQGVGSVELDSNIQHDFVNCISPCEIRIDFMKYLHEDCSSSFSAYGDNWEISLVSFTGDTLLTTNTNSEGFAYVYILCDSLESWTTNGPLSIVETMQNNYMPCSNYPTQHEIYYQTTNTSLSGLTTMSGVIGTYDENGVFIPEDPTNTNDGNIIWYTFEFHNTDFEQSYNCTSSGCVDPGDGSGIYNSLDVCDFLCRVLGL